MFHIVFALCDIYFSSNIRYTETMTAELIKLDNTVLYIFFYKTITTLKNSYQSVAKVKENKT